MPQTLKISSPLKGVNRAFGREAQPANTCYDALNVMPFDRYGRMRVAQRSGIGSLLTLDNGQSVRCLHVASTATPTASRTTTTTVGSSFTHADTDLGNVAGWKTYGTTSNLTFPSADEVTDAFAISSNAAVASQTYDYDGAIFQTSIVFGTHYDASIKAAFASLESNGLVALYAGMDDNDSVPSVVAQVELTNGLGAASVKIGIGSGSTLATLAVGNGTFAAGVQFTLGLRRRDNSISVLIGGVVKATYTLTATQALTLNSSGFVAFQVRGNGFGVVTLDDLSVTSVVTDNATRTTLKLVATSGADTYVGTPVSMAKTTASATYPIDADSLYVSAATLFGFTYIVDGTSIRKLDLSDNTMKAFTASAGTAPTGCDIACAYRGRLILAGAVTDPQNFFASKVGDPLNWDYGASSLPTSAYAGNDSDSGHVGQPIQALIPMSDDLLVIGCEQSIWKMTGDISNGGSLSPVTEFAGISSSTSWTRSPDGSLYFVGPRGFFKMDPSASNVQEISEMAYPQYFQNINRKTNAINLMYDADRYGIWIFVTPHTQGAVGTSMFYDLRAEGFWPQNFETQLNAGPLSCIWWDGYDSDSRYPVLGGYDGGLYAFNATNRTDNGGIISAYVLLGPIKPSNVDATLIGATFNMGELSVADSATPSRWNSNFSLYAGKSAYEVTEGTPTVKGVVTWGDAGRTKTLRQRLRGEWFAVLVQNSASANYFSFESVDLEFNTTGRNRKQGL